MSYTLQALIGDLEHLISVVPPGVRLVRLPQGKALIPVSTDVQCRYGISFLPLTDEGETEVPPGLQLLVKSLLGRGQVAYVEAEFFGGEGTQAYVLWDESGEPSSPVVHRFAINEALRRMKVVCGASDEFDAIELLRHRFTDDWELDAIPLIKEA